MSDKNQVMDDLKKVEVSLDVAKKAEMELVSFAKDTASAFYTKLMSQSDSLASFVKSIPDSVYWTGEDHGQMDTQQAHGDIEGDLEALDLFVDDLSDKANNLRNKYQTALFDLKDAINGLELHDEELMDSRVAEQKKGSLGLNELYGV